MRAAAIVSLALLSACHPRVRRHENYRLPMSEQTVARIASGDGLVSYLRQADADPAVCAPREYGPYVVLPNQRELEDLVDGIGRGVRVEPWEACVQALLRVLPPSLGAHVVNRLLERYAERIAYSELERDGEILAQLDAIRRLYDERPAGTSPSPELIAEIEDRLRAAAPHTTHTGSQYHAALMSVLYLEHGLTPSGAPITEAALDRLVEESDEGSLVVYSRRLPDPALREEARRRLVRVRIRLSEFTELRAQAAEVEARVLATGRNALQLEGPPTLAQLDEPAFPVLGLVLRQDVSAQQATLLGYRAREEEAGPVPALDLRGLVRFRVPGFARPVSVCAPPEALDPSPCIDPAEMGLGVDFVTQGQDGRFHFAERVPIDTVLDLARGGDSLALPILFRGGEVARTAWALRFRTDGALVFQPGYGAPGPRVEVSVDATGANVIVAASSGGAPRYAVVEPEALDAFRVLAAGGSGSPGQDGPAGAGGRDGESGRNASCPNTAATAGQAGGPGGNGGAGGPGGDGGPGGVLVVRGLCKPEDCAQMQQTLEATMRAPGGAAGPGGRGGAGGAGGRGGRGGSAATCGEGDEQVELPAGQDGADGVDGAPGPDGPDGRPGGPGRVQITVRPSP